MKALIRVQNSYSWLTTDSEELKEILYLNLRFRAKDYWRSRFYKNGVWNGYDEFFQKQKGRFLSGLLPEIEFALRHLKVDYQIVDERTFPKFRYTQIDPDFLQQWNTRPKPFVLHDYQCDLAMQALRLGRATIQAPTSAGKTELMIAILKCLDLSTPTLILGNRNLVVRNAYERMIDWGFTNVGRLYDKYEEPSMITCANVSSLHKMEKVLPHIRCLIVDEIHDMMSKTPKKFYNRLSGCGMRIAISATPFKFGGKDMTQKYSVKGYFGPILKTKSEAADENGLLTTKRLQERGQLSASDCTFFEVKEPDLMMAIYQDAVQLGIAENVYFHKMVTKLATSLKGRTLIIVERLEHGDQLAQMIPGALWVQGKDNEASRAFVINELQKSQEDRVAIATQGIFNSAINVFVHNLINAAGGQAEHIIIQKMGRGLRTAEDKVILNYYDFLFLMNEYLEKHSRKRIRVLKGEGHNVRVKAEMD